MIAQSIYHGVRRFDSRGRKLILKTLEAHAGLERQRFGELDGHERLEIVADAIGAEDVVGGWGGSVEALIFRQQSRPVPSLVITLELKSETYPVAADALVLIPRQDAGFALHQLVIIAEQPEGNTVRAGGDDAFHHTGPALLRVVKKFGDSYIQFDAPPRDFEVDLDLLGL